MRKENFTYLMRRCNILQNAKTTIFLAITALLIEFQYFGFLFDFQKIRARSLFHLDKISNFDDFDYVHFKELFLAFSGIW